MQDAKFGHGENAFELRQAVYVFAGGTAQTLDSFALAHSERFVAAKGPDFVSRLRGNFDVRGPNDPVFTKSRRALLIQYQLDQNQSPLPKSISDDLRESLFNEGRYRHGARSLASLLDAGAAQAAERGGAKIERGDLPKGNVLAIHVDQGPLDDETIGGLIGCSVGKEIQREPESSAGKCVQDLISALWQNGATIGYGGRWDMDLTDKILKSSHRLERPTATREVRLEIFSRGDKPIQEQGSDVEVVSIFSSWVPQVAREDDIKQNELSDYLNGYRMRWAMTLSVQGAHSGWWKIGLNTQDACLVSLRRPCWHWFWVSNLRCRRLRRCSSNNR